MKVDYIIVGLGLAGLAFSRELEKENKSFIVFENKSQHSSKVAGGMYNPIILKRFTPVWDAENQLKIAIPFYKNMELLLGNKYDYKVDVYRLFTSIEEQNNWFAACDNPTLSSYMVPKVITDKFNGIDALFGYGKVTHTGRIDTNKLIEDYHFYLEKSNKILYQDFEYNRIDFNENKIQYKNIETSKIVFCEGFGIKKNPFFKELPMQEAKGELITIHAPELDIDFVLKSSVFIMPLGNQLFKVGATFNWKDKTSIPSKEGKEELLTKLKSILNVPFEVVEHVAGIRPTVKDRRPLVGLHKEYKNIALLNGLGTRGVMIAPTVAKELYNHIENDMLLRNEISIKRFENN
ncbi:NAD(P)/FAD-dependent oxidoreductase [Urechidicola croceus]|uniref:FAD-dependent oxidoreductase n=1 Tax=Urechidicola croceus TaxID=1850246 RepID=A0A1D8PAV4_9FLAO|nr:FAD-dependent oxidoreductase [Urechidicola croceus]AOW21682.1 FAD-dependent oxidoreductase [Urechidicola croceus]